MVQLLILPAHPGNVLQALAAWRAAHGIGFQRKAQLLIPVLLLVCKEDEPPSTIPAELVHIIIVRDRYRGWRLAGKIGCNRSSGNHSRTVIRNRGLPTEHTFHFSELGLSKEMGVPVQMNRRGIRVRIKPGETRGLAVSRVLHVLSVIIRARAAYRTRQSPASRFHKSCICKYPASAFRTANSLITSPKMGLLFAVAWCERCRFRTTGGQAKAGMVKGPATVELQRRTWPE
jgi:hypothetical protein